MGPLLRARAQRKRKFRTLRAGQGAFLSPRTRGEGKSGMCLTHFGCCFARPWVSWMVEQKPGMLPGSQSHLPSSFCSLLPPSLLSSVATAFAQNWLLEEMRSVSELPAQVPETADALGSGVGAFPAPLGSAFSDNFYSLSPSSLLNRIS